jgi:chitinase domain-containing protein 1
MAGKSKQSASNIIAQSQKSKQKRKQSEATHQTLLRVLAVVILGVLIATAASFVGDASGSGKRRAGQSSSQESPSLPDIDEDLDLVSLSANYATISNPRVSQRPGITNKLGFLTTWNAQGKEIASGTLGKFSILSPVWFRIGPDAVLEGVQDVDQEWLQSLRDSEEGAVKIMPRFMFQDWDAKELLAMLSTKAGMMKVTTLIIKTCKKFELDGVVLDMFNSIASEFTSEDAVQESKEQIFKFIRAAGRAIQKADLDLVLVIPPYPELVGPEDLVALEPIVTFFQVMTYDHHPLKTMAPNAPIAWMEDVVTKMSPEADSEVRRKILLGLNMYGTMHKLDSEDIGKHIIGTDFIQFIEQYDLQCRYHEAPVAEHVCQFVAADNSRYITFYPSEKSLSARLDLAEKLGTGVALWELGQTVPSYLEQF